jgi:hypothetical protein
MVSGPTLVLNNMDFTSFNLTPFHPKSIKTPQKSSPSRLEPMHKKERCLKACTIRPTRKHGIELLSCSIFHLVIIYIYRRTGQKGKRSEDSAERHEGVNDMKVKARWGNTVQTNRGFSSEATFLADL